MGHMYRGDTGMTYNAVIFLAELFRPMDSLSPDRLSASWRVAYEERAGIMEYCGCLPRRQAEAEAMKDVRQRVQAEKTRKLLLDSCKVKTTMLGCQQNESETGGHSGPTAAGDSGQRLEPLSTGPTHGGIPGDAFAFRSQPAVDHDGQCREAGEGTWPEANAD